jgi:protein-disulfide isomerase
MRTTAAVAALAGVLLSPVSGQEPGITRQQADQILSELREIRRLLEKQARAEAQQEPEPQRAKIAVKPGSNILGSPNAPLTMVEFTDYQCPFCQRFHTDTFYEIKKNWIDTGKLRFVSRDFPLGFHPNAFRAAAAARCAGDQKQFWRMRDMLASNPSKLAPADLTGYAKEMQLDLKAFQACLDSGKYKAAVDADVGEAQKLGVSGTPSFILGRSTPVGVDGEIVVGALPYAAFDEKLKGALPQP